MDFKVLTIFTLVFYSNFAYSYGLDKKFSKGIIEGELEILNSENFNEERNSVRDMGNSPYGIFIVVGPTGSGKSTTLYSILNEIISVILTEGFKNDRRR